MVTKYILNLVASDLSLTFYLTSKQILTNYLIPDLDIDFFVRLKWTFGDLKDISNLSGTETIILNFLIYLRKYGSEGLIIDYAQRFKKRYFSILNFINIEDSYTKIDSVKLILNNNDKDWNGYVLSISFRSIENKEQE